MSALGPITIDQAKKLLRAIDLYVNDNTALNVFLESAVSDVLKNGKSEALAETLLAGIREKEISEVTEHLKKLHPGFNDLLGLYAYLTNALADVITLPEAERQDIASSLQSKDPSELFAKISKHVANPSVEQSIEVIYHLMHLALSFNIDGHFASSSQNLSTFLQDKLSQLFANVFEVDDQQAINDLVEKSISVMCGTFQDSFAEAFHEALYQRKLSKVEKLEKQQRLATNELYDVNEKLVSAQQRLTNLIMIAETKGQSKKKLFKFKPKENTSNELIDRATEETKTLRDITDRKRTTLMTLKQFARAANGSATYFKLPEKDSVASIKCRS